MAANPYRYAVSEWDGFKTTVAHGTSATYAEARAHALDLSSRGANRDKAFKILGDYSEVIAVARNGKVTNPDGTGPDVDPDA